jgi:hypothetical protein
VGASLPLDARISHHARILVELLLDVRGIRVAADAASAAGGAPTISVFDELWGYTSERSRRLFDEMLPTPTKKISCRLTVTYAGFSGESELLEDLYRRGVELPELDPVNAPGLRGGDGLLFFWSHEPAASWQTPAWLAEMRRSLRPNQYLRMIENRWTSNEEGFIDLTDWDQCVDPLLRPTLADRSLPVYAAVDASTKHDSSALVATTWDRKHQRIQLVAHKIFQPTPESPMISKPKLSRPLSSGARGSICACAGSTHIKCRPVVSVYYVRASKWKNFPNRCRT